MEALLYNRNLSSPTIIEDLSERITGLRYTTQLHGGFGIAHWRPEADIGEAFDWFEKYVFCRVLITDQQKTVWEGRVQDIELGLGGVEIVAYGYYASMADQVESTSYNTTADAAIKAALTAHCPDIASDQSNIDATDITITSAAGDQYLDITTQEMVELLLPFGDTSDQQYYFAIWEDRVPYLKARAASSIDWHVSLRDFVRLRLRHMGGDMYNRCYALYQSGGAVARTATVNDTESQDKYGDGTNALIREKVLEDSGSVAQAAAEAKRSTFLANNAEIRPRSTDMVIGGWEIQDDNEAMKPLSWVRAGEVLRIDDLVPTSSDAGSVTLDAKRTFYIMETEFDVDRQTLSIVPDTNRTTLEALLAKGRLVS